MRSSRHRVLFSALGLLLSLVAAPATADIAVDRVIIDLRAEDAGTADVEVRNVGPMTRYVAVEAAEVVDPGTDGERRVTATDPEALGLLVSPTRLVLEPGARRVVRIVRLGEPGASERVWRIGIRPVVGATTSDTNALQVLVGYGVLVVARPPEPTSTVIGERRGRTLVLRNEGNTNVLLFDGEQCDRSGGDCRALPVRRLYAGNTWSVPLTFDTPVAVQIQGPDGPSEQRF